MESSQPRRAWLAMLLAIASVMACVSKTDVSIGTDCAQGFCADPPPTFTPGTPDGGDAEASVEPPELLACIGTECPAPYATCGKKPTFLCGTNLKNDPANCGACGVSCQGFEGLNLGSRCVDGACVFECLIREGGSLKESFEFRNCNGLLDDGCEVNITADAKNCGACGNACKAGDRCIKGKCGCTSGKIDCNGRCIDPRFDDYNCKTCGNVCGDPADACPDMPPNTYYGCGLGECGRLKCTGGFDDCDGDLNEKCASNGCETDTSTDPMNCGACGIQCGPGQECRNDGNGPQCLDTCDKAGLTTCPFGCADLVRDRFNCGACGVGCANPRANEETSCRKGLCEKECIPGFADCNGDPTDGCEVDLKIHPANCGACGNQCNFGAGQPCIEGKCLMVDCDAGVETK